MATSEQDLTRLAYGIPDFRGIFSIHRLPAKPLYNEKSIIHIAKNKNTSTGHWVCYQKDGNKIRYFDSFGNLPPPLELFKYWGENKIITYNRSRYQKYSENICGQLCILFLRNPELFQ